MSPFLHAVPLFAILIAIEWAFARWQNRSLVTFDDSVRNISCGVIEELIAVFSRFATAGAYIYLFNHHSLIHLKPNVLTWLVALVGVDFFYYWFHRASHRVGILWAMHSVHHQSEYYNLTVALRQSALGGFLSWIFYLPLANSGVPPELMAASYAINLLFQFWIHTEAIRNMGWLETIINTPSHHRVHHGRNPCYIDKNYAGALICWDRFFQTFVPEEEKPDYGVVSRLRSENPVWVNFEGWVLLYEKSNRAPTIFQKAYAWIAPPEWEPASRGVPSSSPLGAARPPFAPPSLVAWDFALNLLLTVGFSFLPNG